MLVKLAFIERDARGLCETLGERDEDADSVPIVPLTTVPLKTRNAPGDAVGAFGDGVADRVDVAVELAVPVEVLVALALPVAFDDEVPVFDLAADGLGRDDAVVFTPKPAEAVGPRDGRAMDGSESADGLESADFEAPGDLETLGERLIDVESVPCVPLKEEPLTT